jgi:DNA-binding MarR family transcriptional regulator
LKTTPCTFYIRAIYHFLKHVGKLENKNQPLNSSQQSILFLLSSRPEEEVSLGEIKEELNLSQTGIAKLTTQLEQRGCIHKFVDEKDQRVKKVKLLDKGREYCERARADVLDVETGLLEGLSEEDCDKLKEYLSILYHNSRRMDKPRS